MATTATSVAESSGKVGLIAQRYSCTVDLPSLADGAQEVVTITIYGAKVGDAVVVNPRTAFLAGLVIAQAYVSAADTVKVLVSNTQATARDAASDTWDVTLIRGRQGISHAG